VKDDFVALTAYGPGSPMGRLLREYWVPAVPGTAVDADGPPFRLKLLGLRFVVFRDTEGRVGVLDEACPHRGASLVLGRNERCGLRCLYHGWKFDVAGRVLETPREPNPDFVARLPQYGYPVEERAGIIWLYLGAQEPAPPMPDYPFLDLAPDQVGTIVVTVRADWLTAMESVWDPTHVPVLHSSSVKPGAAVASTILATEPCHFDVERTPYGFRIAMINPMEGDRQAVRMMEYLFPYLRPSAQTPAEDSDIVAFGMVPMDDHNTMWWFIHYNHDHSPAVIGYPIQDRGRTGIVSMSSGEEGDWGQDRSAMDRHFTGIGLDRPALGVLFEDVAILESMVPTLDRSRHRLTGGDSVVVKGRRLVRQFLDEYERGITPPDHTDAGRIRPRMIEIPATSSWRDHYPAALIGADPTDPR
jgi:phthalate 4,5-dioxygenase oxygenase subunit